MKEFPYQDLVRKYNAYNPDNVLMGNWFEDVCLSEDRLKEFIAKQENGFLLLQHIEKILGSFLKQTELVTTKDGFVHFGDKIMVINLGQEKAPLSQAAPARLPHALSINAEESVLCFDSVIKPPVDLSASRLLHPCRRNTFVITSVDGTPNGETLCYGQPFTLSTLPGFTGNLKLWSQHIRMDEITRAKKSKKQLASFRGEVTYNSVWNVLNVTPDMRDETEGLPVPANVKVVIRHCKTGEKLGMLPDSEVNTTFGGEWEVAAKTMLHPRFAEVPAETDKNHWSFVTSNPEDTPSTLEQRVQKHINEDIRISKEEEEKDAKKHWMKVDPKDQKPSEVFCYTNAMF